MTTSTTARTSTAATRARPVRDRTPWPDNALDAAQRAFDLLTRDPAGASFDWRGLAGLPQRAVALNELQRLLAGRDLPTATRDQVWSQLVVQARRDGPSAVVIAVGLSLPALRWTAGRLTRGWHGDTADLDSELLLGFLERLQSIDPGQENLAGHLVGAGAQAVKRHRRHSERQQTPAGRHPGPLPPIRTVDHPELVLARAVAAGVIGGEECDLIASTRLDDIPLAHVAQRLGITVPTARAWRYRGEHALREAISAGDLTWVHLPRARRTPAAA